MRSIHVQVVSRDIRRMLTLRARYFNIVLDDVSITNLTFSREYTSAVEAKQVAQQDAERAKFIVRREYTLCDLCRAGVPSLWGFPDLMRSLNSGALFLRFFSSNPTRIRQQVEKAQQDKQSAIIRAQGEAQSATLIGQAIRDNPSFITLRKIEAAREIAGTVAASPNRVYLSADGLLLNVPELDGTVKKK